MPQALVPLLAVSTATQVVGAVEQKRQAGRLERQQAQQARLQERISAARTKRSQRLKQAQLQAVTGAAGIGGSAVTAPTIAGQVAEQGQIELIEDQTALQVEQFGIQRAQTAAQANAAIAGAVGSFASTLVSPTPGKTQGTLGGDFLASFKGN